MRIHLSLIFPSSFYASGFSFMFFNHSCATFFVLSVSSYHSFPLAISYPSPLSLFLLYFSFLVNALSFVCWELLLYLVLSGQFSAFFHRFLYRVLFIMVDTLFYVFLSVQLLHLDHLHVLHHRLTSLLTTYAFLIAHLFICLFMHLYFSDH